MKSLALNYQPDDQILARYAHVLVNYALNSGSGVKPLEVVQCILPDTALPLYGHLHRAILTAGAHPFMRLFATGYDAQFYELANDAQLTFFPKNYLRSRVRLIDHSIAILADKDLHELESVNPQKIMKAMESQKAVRTWLSDKEYQGRFTWTCGLYGTPAMAKEVGLSLKAYWDQIISACFLDHPDPVKKWQTVSAEIDRLKNSLNRLAIKTIRLQAKGTDLTLTLGEKRQFVGGGGRNIPSFEIFTSPDWRGTEGYISFDQPFYRYGTLIKGIELKFVSGKIVSAHAAQGNSLLQEIIKRPNADKIGEFSLTDSRLSRIDQFMANTLYDENYGGQYGNTHLAIGMSYKDAFAGDPQKLNKRKANSLGFNDSGEHCDFVSSTPRTVTAILADGTSIVIYQDGHFTL